MCVVKGGASSASSCGSSSSSSFSRCSAFSRAGAARRRRVTSRGSLCWPPALSNLGRCTSAAKKTSPTQTPTTSTSTPPNIRTVPSAANSSRAWCTCNRTWEPASPRAPFPSRPQITHAQPFPVSADSPAPTSPEVDLEQRRQAGQVDKELDSLRPHAPKGAPIIRLLLRRLEKSRRASANSEPIESAAKGDPLAGRFANSGAVQQRESEPADKSESRNA